MCFRDSVWISCAVNISYVNDKSCILYICLSATRRTLDKPRLLDEAEMQRLLEERQKQIAEYKEFRQQVEAWRAQDRAARNQTKIKQLDDAQALQVSFVLM